MRYVKQSDNSIVDIFSIRRANANSSIPDGADLSSLGYLPLIETIQPERLPWHTIQESMPIDNVQTWIQVPISNDEIIQICTNEIQRRLDEFAKTRGYDNIFTACTYITSPNTKFALEAQDCVNLRDATWGQCYQILADVQSGARPMPSLDELLAELPVLAWTTI